MRLRLKTKWKRLVASLIQLEHWDKLRNLIASRLVQATIVVPVIGYMILFSVELQEFLKLTIDSKLIADSEVSVNSWRLYFLYFGFSSLAVSAIIFNVRCPDEVKLHGNAFDFVDKQKPIMREARLRNMAELLEYYEYEVPVDQKRADIDIAAIMTNYFEIQEQEHPKSRRTVLVFYLFGLALLAVPTIHTFILVIRAAWRGFVGA